MAVLILAISAVIMLSFGGQTILTDSQTNVEAIAIAQGLLENEQALARKDFKLVVPINQSGTDPPCPPQYIYDGARYCHKVEVETQPDYLTKKVTARVAWQAEHNRVLNTSLTAFVTNFQNAVGGDTCDSVLSGNWQSPLVKNPTTDFAALAGDPSGTYSITDLDAREGKLYITTSNSAAGQETFFVLDIGDSANPAVLGKVDNNSGANTGLNAVAVATNSGGSFAYAANAIGASYSTCADSGGTNASCGQLQVIDISPNPPEVKYTLKMPGVTGSGGQAIGNSIFYQNGYVYLGLTKTASGPEFNIIDVHNPLAPSWVGGFALGNTVNAIAVRNGYAYLASPNSEELKIIDVRNPANPVFAGSFDAPGGSGNGKSVDTLGDQLYLGRTLGGNEFYVLDNANPASTLPSLGSLDLGASESLNDFVVRDYLAFLLTTSQLEIFRVDNPASIVPWVSVPLAASGSDVEPSLDCEGNTLYIGSNDDPNDKGSLSIITAGP